MGFTLTELLLLRQWLVLQSTSANMSKENAELATKWTKDVDKKIWSWLIVGREGSETVSFSDETFKQTLKEIFGDGRNVDE